MNPVLFPAACRKYAELSPDVYCKNHLETWLDTNGRTLKSFGDWLKFRLENDNKEIGDLQFPFEF